MNEGTIEVVKATQIQQQQYMDKTAGKQKYEDSTFVYSLQKPKRLLRSRWIWNNLTGGKQCSIVYRGQNHGVQYQMRTNFLIKAQTFFLTSETSQIVQEIIEWVWQEYQKHF